MSVRISRQIVQRTILLYRMIYNINIWEYLFILTHITYDVKLVFQYMERSVVQGTQCKETGIFSAVL